MARHTLKDSTPSREPISGRNEAECPPELILHIDNRLAFLAGIRRFCWHASEAELAEMKRAIRKREAKLRPPAVQGDGARGEMNKLAARREEILQSAIRRSRLKPANLDEKTRTYLAEIEQQIQSLATRFCRPAKKRGRPRAEESLDWIARAWAVMIARSLGWTWTQATIASGLTPTKANKRTVQRRQEQLARLLREGVRLPIESELL